MFIIQVIPLIRGTQLESLSYFSSLNYQIGSFLTIPIRGKNQTGIVIDTKPVGANKTSLKTATFSLRKLPKQVEPTIIPETIRQTAELLTKRYPSSIGALLFAFLPSDIKNNSALYPKITSKKQHEETTPQILTAPIKDRYIYYQSLIRSTFAHHGSIMIVVPTNTEISRMTQNLSLGIGDRIIVFSPYQTKKQREKSYQKLSDRSKTALIITTPSHAYLEREDMLTIVIEQAASSHYTSRYRPYLDHREALISYAQVAGRSIILGDTIHRTEDEVKRRNEQYLTYGEEVKRLIFNAPLNIITQNDKPKPNEPFKLFSKELLINVERTLEANGHVFFYAARRGLAPVVACIDCGFIFRCPDSNTPYSLIRTNKNNEEQRWFISNTSGRRVRAADVCSNCGSWRLRERGIGIQQIYDEWKKIFPDIPTTVIDTTTATTTKQIKSLVDDFYQKKNGVLIGTQITLPFIEPGIDISAIISLDAARSIPTWRADESLFRLITYLRECTKKEVLIQTRTEIDNLLIYASRGAIERFYDDEIALRDMVQYPPYSDFILLSWLGTNKSVLELEKPIQSQLSDYNLQFYNNPNSTSTKTLRHALIRIPTNNQNLYSNILNKLRVLPPYVKIEINPERIV